MTSNAQALNTRAFLGILSIRKLNGYDENL